MKTTYWIVLVIILAIVFYWLWSSNGTETPPANNQTTETESSSVALAAQNDSGQSGTAVLTAVGNQTRVVVTTTGSSAFTAPQPAHIHVGACPEPGAVAYPLTNLVGGTSITTIDASLAELEAALPLAINIHKSAAEASVYTACGNLNL